MQILTFISYILLSYGIANLFVYSNGPFHIFERWRKFTNWIHPQVGELFTCMLCISTWIGLALSLIDIYLFNNLEFTPFNIILSDVDYPLLVVLFDMAATSASVWLLHQFEEMMERIEDYE